jgi:hypothetical protein
VKRLLALSMLCASPLLAAEPAGGPAAPEAFARLKGLAGVWEGTAMTAEGPPATVSYEVVSNGNAVLERMFAGTPHEMLNVYHLDGADLVTVHYCSAGNQPRMKYVPAASTASELAFDYAGGTNIDVGKDMHVHGGRLFLREDGRLEEEWSFWKGGKQGEKARLFLKRK